MSVKKLDGSSTDMKSAQTTFNRTVLGQPRQRRIRYPIVKKRTSSSRKAAKKTA